MTIAFLNGDFLPLEETKISVLDRGFIFGDGVYEFIPCFGGKTVRLEAHLARLDRSCNEIRLVNPHSIPEWISLVEELITKNNKGDLGIYIQVTRGIAKRDHAFPQHVSPTVFMMANPLSAPPKEQIENGVACISLPDNRWLRCDIKSTSLLANVLLRQTAVDAGCAEAVLFRDGLLTEGAACNILVVKDNTIFAPPKNNLILSGITYDLVMELCATNVIRFEIREITQDEVKNADELLLTSSGKEVVAITKLDQKVIGNGKPGPIFSKLHNLYQEYKTRIEDL